MSLALTLLLSLPLAVPALPTTPDACPALAKRLRAPHKSTVADLRQLLDRIGAEVPNDMGQFLPRPPPPVPRRKKGEPPPPPPREIDWLTDLAAAEVPPEVEAARLEAVDLVATVRALAATRRYDKDCPAAKHLLDFAFEDLGGVFRDEVGRQVRKMEAYALPPLIRLAMGTGKVAKGERRYANYQLDRMDRQRPETVMAQVHDDPVRAEVLLAWGETRPSSAVHVVLGEIDASSPRVRRAARWAWMQYVTRKPPEPPKRRLKLTGGKQSDKEQELYLTYRELADLEIRRQWPALMGEPADPQKSLEDLSAEVFVRKDAERTARWDALFAKAEDQRTRGDFAGAVALYGWILAQDPFYGRRGEMVLGYLRLGQQLAAAGRFAEAGGWLRQAAALAQGVGPQADDARRAVEAELALVEAQNGLSRGAEDPAAFEHALALDPQSQKARAALRELKKKRLRRTARSSSKAAAALGALALGCVLLWRRARS